MTPTTFKTTRERLGMSRAAFARALGIAPNSATAYELGRQRVPRVVALAAAALIHGLDAVE